MAEYTGAELEELRKKATEARERLVEAMRGKSIHDVVDEYTLEALVVIRLALDSQRRVECRGHHCARVHNGR